MNASVVIVYPTDRDGSIVRWYASEAERAALRWLHAEAVHERDVARTDLANLQAVAARFAEQAEVELAERTAQRDRAVRDADRAGEIRHATWVQAQRLRGELAVSMSQTASNHAKLLDALGIEGDARQAIDPLATVRGLRDYIEQQKARIEGLQTMARGQSLTGLLADRSDR